MVPLEKALLHSFDCLGTLVPLQAHLNAFYQVVSRALAPTLISAREGRKEAQVVDIKVYHLCRQGDELRMLFPPAFPSHSVSPLGRGPYGSLYHFAEQSPPLRAVPPTGKRTIL